MSRKKDVREQIDYESDPHTRLKHAFYRRAGTSPAGWEKCFSRDGLQPSWSPSRGLVCTLTALRAARS